MKIRPTDSSGIPPDPEEIQEKKKPGFPELEGEGEGVATSAKTRGNKGGVSADVLDSLRQIKDSKELGRRFVDLALSDLGESLSGGDLERARAILQSHIEDDPFIQGKLERISSLLSKD